MVRSTSGLLACVCFAARAISTFAQIYSFEQLPVPNARSLQTLYAFYVYSHQDAPDKSLGAPFVKFHDIKLRVPADAAEPPNHNSGVQLAMLPYNDFWRYIDPVAFCEEDSGRLIMQLPNPGDPVSSNVFTQSLNATIPPKDEQFQVRETGAYVLALANCGNVEQATIEGSVVVKNAYGFLPGNEYHKMPFYAATCLIYGILALIWMVLSLIQWKNLFNIQYCIAIVVFFGLVESFLWLLFYKGWNQTGVRGTALFTMSILSSVVKSIFSYMLILVASLGWGVTRPYLDHKTILKIKALSAAYIVLDFAREWALSFRHSLGFSLMFVVVCLLPVSLLNGAIFYWIFSALSNMIELLKERRQADKLLLFQRLWFLLVCVMSVASFAMIFQVFDVSRSIATRWKYQWFVADGISSILFLIVLCVLMVLWAPADNAKRYSYQAQEDDGEANADGKSKTVATWAEGGGDEDEEEESFWSQTQTQGE